MIGCGCRWALLSKSCICFIFGHLGAEQQAGNTRLTGKLMNVSPTFTLFQFLLSTSPTKIPGCLSAKCSTFFTSWSLTVSGCCLLLLLHSPLHCWAFNLVLRALIYQTKRSNHNDILTFCLTVILTYLLKMMQSERDVHVDKFWKPQQWVCICAGRDSVTLTVSITAVFMVWGNLLPCVQEPRLKPEPDVSRVILTWGGSSQLDGRNCVKPSANPSDAFSRSQEGTEEEGWGCGGAILLIWSKLSDFMN